MFGNKKPKIKVTNNGPYLVSGNVPINKESIVSNEDGDSVKWKRGKDFKGGKNYSLCRCGNSSAKPFCDGSHVASRFDGKETDSKKSFKERAKKYDGPNLELSDAEEFCASARFCERAGGIWSLTEKSDDKKSKKLAIDEACNCPSGRLVQRDKKSGEEIEPKFEPNISVTEDLAAGVSGPLWVKGRIPIESVDGEEYEVRNRVTLCRCGNSKNKPFCDGSHIKSGFRG